MITVIAFAIFMVSSGLLKSQTLEIPITVAGNGVYYLNLQVNGIDVLFQYEQAARGLTLNSAVLNNLRRQGALGKSNNSQPQTNRNGAATWQVGQTVVLKSLKVGTGTLNNVQALVSQNSTSPTIGNEALSRLGQVQADFRSNKILIMTSGRANEKKSGGKGNKQ